MGINKDFLSFYSYFEFSTQIPNIISKALTLCSAKVLSQEDSRFARYKKNSFFSLPILGVILVAAVGSGI
jgi:hypothetical protein